MTKIYMIRHTSVNVPRGTCYGQTDVEVNATFEQEAAVSKAGIEGLHFDKVFSSPLHRCVKLATFCGYPDAERRDEIKEINFGQWEMRKYDDIHDAFIEAWYRDYVNTRAPGGESFKDQFERVALFLDEMRGSKYSDVLVFTHGGVMACSLLYCGKVEIKDVFSHVPDYGKMITFEL